MSQRKEKYARSMEARMKAMEIKVREISAKEARRQADALDIAPYTQRAAEIVRKDYREDRKKYWRRKAMWERVALAIIVCAILAVILVAVMSINVSTTERDGTIQAPATLGAGEIVRLAAMTYGEDGTTPSVNDLAIDHITRGEDPLEAEKITEALLMQGYFSLAVPMSYEYQDYMRTYCAAYGCPYPMALAVAETESNFDPDAVGTAGEVGIMQLNPGPGGAYHKEVQDATGLDPTTVHGNIAGGCYLLGKYLDTYGGDYNKAAMAYNLGQEGAAKLWDAGIMSTEYSRTVLEAMERWECTVNAWNGI